MEPSKEDRLKLHEELAQKIAKHQQTLQQMNLEYKQIEGADIDKLQEIKISKQIKAIIIIQKIWKGRKLRRNMNVLTNQNIKIKAAFTIQRARERAIQKKEITKFYEDNPQLKPLTDIYKTLSNAEYICNMSANCTG